MQLLDEKKTPPCNYLVKIWRCNCTETVSRQPSLTVNRWRTLSNFRKNRPGRRSQPVAAGRHTSWQSHGMSKSHTDTVIARRTLSSIFWCASPSEPDEVGWPSDNYARIRLLATLPSTGTTTSRNTHSIDLQFDLHLPVVRSNNQSNEILEQNKVDVISARPDSKARFHTLTHFH